MHPRPLLGRTHWQANISRAATQSSWRSNVVHAGGRPRKDRRRSQALSTGHHQHLTCDLFALSSRGGPITKKEARPRDPGSIRRIPGAGAPGLAVFETRQCFTIYFAQPCSSGANRPRYQTRDSRIRWRGGKHHGKTSHLGAARSQAGEREGSVRIFEIRAAPGAA